MLSLTHRNTPDRLPCLRRLGRREWDNVVTAGHPGKHIDNRVKTERFLTDKNKTEACQFKGYQKRAGS
jgi:hypothetical protein